MTTEKQFRYEITADVDAPVARVWRAWTDETEYEAWSRSAPGSVAQDVRPGGKWSAAVVGPDGQEFPITGTYIDVVEHERLDMGMDAPDGGQELMRMEFADIGDDRTRLTITQDCDTQEACDQSKQGSQMLLDWCAEYVTRP
ncbi:SRPBCC family protein [Glycomyces tenuis]|uniref:SRPBCC family protein n=1 Tax=Glycomyces tenuis TaxID=58116 RepID=UPI0003FD8D92|nr:SRPBCC domain-containing protein [Glycomyces tenuis]